MVVEFVDADADPAAVVGAGQAARVVAGHDRRAVAQRVNLIAIGAHLVS